MFARFVTAVQLLPEQLLRHPQRLVDQIGMYRTVTLALGGLLLAAVCAGAVGWLAYSPLTQLQAVVPAVLLALLLNIILARVLSVHANHESAIITALILFFLALPASSFVDNWPLFAAVVVAVVSKFVLVYKKQHIFNAAALGAAALSVPGWYEFSWWVSNPVLLLPTLILGGLVVMKVRKWTPVWWFIGAGLVVFLFESWRLELDLVSEALIYFTSWPTLFLAAFMLTEPFTMPPTKRTQAWYGGSVGVLSNTTIFGPFMAMSPELALLIGNLLVYPWRLRQKLFLKLITATQIATDTWEFRFEKPARFTFQAGQYLEWMLPHRADSRGERRYFTIASAPSESEVRLALKVVPKGSSYKRTLQALRPGDIVIASQLAGDFTLPRDPSQKLGFIAGGIGITPFRSHIIELLNQNQKTDIALLYCTNTLAEQAYSSEFAAAATVLPLSVIPVIAKEPVEYPAEAGFVTAELLARRVPDFVTRTWYLSGPPPMVHAYSALLVSAGVPHTQIVKDFFPGLA